MADLETRLRRLESRLDEFSRRRADQGLDGLMSYPDKQKLDKYLNHPHAQLKHAATFGVPNNAFTALPWDTAHVNNPGWAGVAMYNAGQSTRLTARVAGRYSFSAYMSFPNSGAGSNRVLALVANGSYYIAMQNGPFNAGAYTRMNVSATVSLQANDYVEVWAYQDSGAGMNSLGGDNYFSGDWLGV